MEQLKKTPQRMCVACRTMHDKADLVRVVKTPDGAIVLDKTGKMAGRGAYLCNNINCFNQSVKARAFNRAFKCNIEPEILNNIKEQFGD